MTDVIYRKMKTGTTSSMRRNGEIDFLRFVFSLLVLFVHFNKNYHFHFFVNGGIAVDFFFLVSGYLMAGHAAKLKSNRHDLDYVADHTWSYVINKIKSFYGYYLSALFLEIVVRNILVNHLRFMKFCRMLLKSIPVFTLSFMGLTRNTESFYVGNSWYLSAMILSIFVLYPFLLWHFKFSTQIIFPFVTLYIFGFLYYKNYFNANIFEWVGFAYFGILRALAEMALGCSLFQLLARIRQNDIKISLDQNNRIENICLTAVKILSYTVVGFYAWGSIFGHEFKNFTLHAVLFCAIGVFLSFSNTGYCIPDCKATRLLGKWSLGIFIYHGFLRHTLLDYFGSDISVIGFAAFIVLSIVASITMMYITDYLIQFIKRTVKKSRVNP